jgi:hypothetical protein
LQHVLSQIASWWPHAMHRYLLWCAVGISHQSWVHSQPFVATKQAGWLLGYPVVYTFADPAAAVRPTCLSLRPLLRGALALHACRDPARCDGRPPCTDEALAFTLPASLHTAAQPALAALEAHARAAVGRTGMWVSATLRVLPTERCDAVML